MSKTINCKNYFNEGSFKILCDELEKGETVSIYIDCIGHTRSYMESEHYKSELIKKYGDRLVPVKDVIFNYTYKLK